MKTSSLRVALVGRPNVGKSSIFNHFAGQHIAVTAAEAGTTRDRIERTIDLAPGVTFVLTDVGGVETETGGDLEREVQKQIHFALAETDLILFVVEVGSALTADDYTATELLRRAGKPFVFVANKHDSGDSARLLDLAELGLGLPLGVSALHHTGFEELNKKLATELRRIKRAKKDLPAPDLVAPIAAKIALIGRPNVGKSSLLNKLLGEPRAIVSAVPCTTRDTNDLLYTHGDKSYRLLDTAGLRRSGRIGTGIDRFATGRTLNSIAEADVALLLLDGLSGLIAQDLHVAEKALDSKKGLILVVNKIDGWDEPELAEKWLRTLQQRFSFARYLPVIFISAQTGKNLNALFPLIDSIVSERRKRVPTRALNLFLKKVLAEKQPGGAYKRMPPKFFYVTQVAVEPPKFVFFVSRAKSVHFSYRRYLENRLREEFGFGGTPIVLELREREREKWEERYPSSVAAKSKTRSKPVKHTPKKAKPKASK